LRARKPQKSRSIKIINKTPAIDCRQSTQKIKKEEDLGACISDDTIIKIKPSTSQETRKEMSTIKKKRAEQDETDGEEGGRPEPSPVLSWCR
jgi:hypothetical protein